ncbi:phosphatase PAP2 family protein [candidate division KSB1 bacterium]|nr:phosphatase PAP2 family protein [candidate division KSB1 bacterium]
MIKAFVHSIGVWDALLCVKVFQMSGRVLFDPLMLAFSRIGDGYFYPIIGLAVFILDPESAKTFVGAGLLAYPLELILYKTLKESIRRSRPFEVVDGIRQRINPPDQFSFPSGHSAAAFLMASLLAWHYPQIALASFFIAGLIAFSRVYNGVHYPGDVLAGCLLGTLSARFGLWLMA